MADHLIYILSADDQTAGQLSEQFSASGYGVNYYGDLNSLIKTLVNNNVLLVLIDYECIVTAERKIVIDLFKMVKKIRSVVFNVPNDTDRRLAFYELGATRVFDKSASLDHVYNSVLWLLHVLASTDEKHKLYSQGTLDDIPLSSLINTLGNESRSGVLKVVTENNNGKIYFIEGDIISAEVGFHKGENAIIQMLFWKNGGFSFSSLKHEPPSHNVSTSIFGIQIIAKQIQQKYTENLEKIGSANSTIRLKNAGDLLATQNDINSRFVEYLQRPHTIEDITENPFYTCFETVNRLLTLKDLGFLIIKEPTKVAAEEDDLKIEAESVVTSKESGLKLRTQDINLIKRNLDVKENETGKILVFSVTSSIATDFLSDLVPMKSMIRSEKEYDIAQVNLGKDLDIIFISFVLSQNVLKNVEPLSGKISGQIFLFEYTNDLDTEYMNYIIRQIHALNTVPSVIAVSNAPEPKEITRIEKNLDFSQRIKIIPFDPELGYKMIRKILVSLKPVEVEETEQEKEEEAAGK
jgi:hypothetical protein